MSRMRNPTAFCANCAYVESRLDENQKPVMWECHRMPKPEPTAPARWCGMHSDFWLETNNP